MKRWRLFHLGLLGIAVVAAALPLRPATAFLLSLPLLGWLPGALLVDAVGWHAARTAAGRLGLEILASVGLYATLVFVLGLADVSADLAPPLLSIGVLLRLALPRSVAGQRDAASWRWPDVAILVLAIGGSATAFLRGSSIGPMDDAGTHLAVLSRIAETGRPLTSSPFLATATPWQYADAWPRMLMAPCRWLTPSTGDLLALWDLAAAAVCWVAVFSFCVLAFECLTAAGAVVAVAALLTLARFETMAFPSGLGVALLWGAFGIVLAAERAPSWRLECVGITLTIAMAAIHPVEAVLLAYGVVVVAIARASGGRSLVAAGSALRRFGLVALTAVPVVVLGNRVVAEQAAAGDLIDPSFELHQLLAGVWTVAPRFWGFDGASPLIWIGVLGAILVVRRGSEPLRSFVVGGIGAAALGLICPLTSAVVLRLSLPSFLLSRTGLLVPWALLNGAVVQFLQTRGRRFGVALVLLAILGVAMRNQTTGASPRTALHSHPMLSAPSQALFRTIPRESVILTDLWSADFLPLLGGHRVVAGITWHTASTRDQLAVWDFLANEHQLSHAALNLLRKHRIDFVVTTDWAGSEFDWPGYGSRFQPEYARAMLVANPSTFVLVGAADRVRLWRVLRPLPEDLNLKDTDSLSLPSEGGAGLTAIGDWEVTSIGTDGEEAVVHLRAVRATRAAPRLALIATSPDFAETSRRDRLLRVVRRHRFVYAEGRPGPTVRIDHQFYLAHLRQPGEGMVVRFSVATVPGDRICVGPAEVLPMFPLPLGPVITRDYYCAPSRSRALIGVRAASAR